MTYGRRTRIRFSLSLSLLWSHLSLSLLHPLRLYPISFSLDEHPRPLVTYASSGDELLTIGRKFTRVRRESVSGRVVRGIDPVERAHARLTIGEFNRRYFQLDRPFSYNSPDYSSRFLLVSLGERFVEVSDTFGTRRRIERSLPSSFF